ncbi:MAG: ATP-binding protein [Dokdonia sp.]|jgi:signal transduction histidine kinase
MKRVLLTICLIFCSHFGVSQAPTRTIDSLLAYNRLEEAKTILNSIAQEIQNEHSIKNARVLVLLAQKDIDAALLNLQYIDSTQLSQLDKAFYYRNWGKLYSKSNFEDQSFEYLSKAKTRFEVLNEQRLANRLNYDLLYLLTAQEHLNVVREDVFAEFEYQSFQLKDPIAIFNLYTLQAAARFDTISKDFFFSKMKAASKIASDISDFKRVELCHSYMGLFYATRTKNEDSAQFHLEKSVQLSKKYGTSDDQFYATLNRAVLPRIQGNYREALEFMHVADTIKLNDYLNKNKRILYGYMSSDYENLNKKDSALLYLKKYITYSDKVDIQTQNRNLTVLNTRELALQNQLETKKRMLNKSLLIAALIALGLGFMFAVFVYKSQQRKKLLLIKENEILLRNQELSSIDAMVAGQASERKRIAEDLHDNLGGLLATIKLYIENFKVKSNRIDKDRDALIAKTDQMLELAYQKVRSMAHERHSGNPISLGLLPALKDYAAAISGSNRLVIEVFAHGDDTRLGNVVELTLFRILQELITNTVKHAFAKAISIDITYFENEISIVFEDDGKGFDHTKITPTTNGMGLISIKRRIKNLKGNVAIDSKIGKGTSILITIPIG